MAHAAATQPVPTGEVAVGDDQRLAELVGLDGSARGQVGARPRRRRAEKDQAIVVLAVDQQRPAVTVALQVGDVGAGDLDGAQRLQAEQTEQRTIAQVLELVVVRNSAKQQRQLDLRQVAEVLGRAAIARARGGRWPGCRRAGRRDRRRTRGAAR